MHSELVSRLNLPADVAMLAREAVSALRPFNVLCKFANSGSFALIPAIIFSKAVVCTVASAFKEFTSVIISLSAKEDVVAATMVVVVVGEGVPAAVIVGAGVPAAVMVGAGVPAAVVVGAGVPFAVVVGAGVPTAVVVRAGVPAAVVVGGGVPAAVVMGAGDPAAVVV